MKSRTFNVHLTLSSTEEENNQKQYNVNNKQNPPSHSVVNGKFDANGNIVKK